MKKLIILSASLILSSCGTILGGHITDCQRTKPINGDPRRIRPAALIGDVFCTYGLGLIVDFADGAIYKPCLQNSLIYPNAAPGNTIEMPGVSKNELYNRAKKWIAENFRSAKDIIQLDDKENGKIIVKSNITYTGKFSRAYIGSFDFTFTFDCKEGKYKYLVEGGDFNGVQSAAARGDFSEAKHRRMINEQGKSEIMSICSRFEQGMKSQYQNKDW